jgi:hypothetical protein
MLSGFSVLYGLLVGLIAVAASQNIARVSDILSNEASSLGASVGEHSLSAACRGGGQHLVSGRHAQRSDDVGR